MTLEQKHTASWEKAHHRAPQDPDSGAERGDDRKHRRRAVRRYTRQSPERRLLLDPISFSTVWSAIGMNRLHLLDGVKPSYHRAVCQSSVPPGSSCSRQGPCGARRREESVDE